MASTREYNATIIETFRANHGDLTGVWQGTPLVLVNTTGARSGQVRTIPLAYLQRGDRLYIVGSGGGPTRHPDWVHNLLAHPEITYELGGDPVPARATLLTGEARARAWEEITAELPFFHDYARKATREIPVFELAPRTA